MAIHCEINLRMPTGGALVAGSVLTGTARYAVPNDTVFKMITITFKGSGHLVVQNTRKRDEDGIVEDREKYVDDNITVLDDDRGQVFHSDCYNTQFCFKLPPNIPPTLNFVKTAGNHKIRCKITYYIIVEFIAADERKRFKTEINVSAGVNPRLSTEPRIYDKQRKLIQLLRDSIVTLKATINNPVSSPGGEAKLTYEVFNDTNVNFKSVESKLVEYTYLPGRQYDATLCKEIVSDIRTSGVRSGENQTMDVSVPIPSDIYSIEHSKLIARDYYVTITVYLPLPYRNVSLKVPLQIGDFVKEFTGSENCETLAPSWEVVDEDDDD